MRRFLQRVAFVYHASYARTVSGVPIDPSRADEILAFLLDQKLIHPRDVSRPIPASYENLLRVHTAAYLESLQDPATLTAIFGAPVPADEVPGILDLQRLSVGGTIQATRLLLDRSAGIAVNLKGGLHHAAPARGMGFCVFNDIAVAIRRLRAPPRGFRDPVLVIDLDLHDGNGTRAVFADDPTVYTFSIHNRTWDDAPEVAATSLALGEGVTDESYLAALRDALPPVIQAHKPRLVFYIAGCDPAADDRLGDWRLTPAGMLERDRFVVDTVRGSGAAPLVIVPGGGYGPSAWRYSARFFGWLVSGNVSEPPSDMELALGRFRPIARQFAEEARVGPVTAEGGNEWSLTDADLVGLAHGSGAEPKVLEHYSRHGLELLLERLGFFKQLRDRGFPHPVLDVAFGHALGGGHTIRVFGDAERRSLVMELRLSRNRRVVPGMDVLYVEWLLLQNPHAAFGGRLAPLPGQEHPGLGMLGEVAAWLLVMCETLGLDGVVFEPAHYYTAALGQHRLRFLEPEDQAWFEALRDAVAGMSLADAERAIGEARVVDEATGAPACWRPAPMVVPATARLEVLVKGPSYERALALARGATHLRLVPRSRG